MSEVAEVKEAEATEYYNPSVSSNSDFSEVIAKVSNALGFRLDSFKVSVKEFYSYLKVVSSNG